MIKAGLNIGNSKISCVVANFKKNNDINILSLLSLPTTNLKKNVVLNYENLYEEIQKLIIDTEKNSQTKLNSVNLSIPLIGSLSNYYSSELDINNEKITELHIKKIINQSQFSSTNTNFYELINHILSYEIDNQIVYNNPIGNHASKIKINFYKLLSKKHLLDNFSKIFKNLKIDIENYVPNSLSSSLSTLTNDEKELGSICIDLGHSTTSISIFENNKYIFGDALSIGSNNVTLDIARGVHTSIAGAERIKNLFGSVLTSPSDEHEIIEVPVVAENKNSFKQINRSILNSIIKPRIEETLEMVWQRIKQKNHHLKKIRNIVLTGGGSQLEGIEEYAKIIFSSNVRIARPHDYLLINEKFIKPNFSDVIGTILFRRADFNDYSSNISNKIKKKAGISTFFTWLDQYI